MPLSEYVHVIVRTSVLVVILRTPVLEPFKVESGIHGILELLPPIVLHQRFRSPSHLWRRRDLAPSNPRPACYLSAGLA